jgi:hypothetical protein
MSDPAPKPPPSPATSPATAPAGPTRRRSPWLDRLTALVLLAATGAAVLAAAPALLQVAGLGPGPGLTAHGGRAATPRAGAEPSSREHPFTFAVPDDDDDPHLTELERLYPDGMWPGQRPDRHAPAAEPGTTIEESRPGPDRRRVGLVRHPITLRSDPGARGVVLGQVQAGEQVMIVKEVGEWVLVVHTGKTVEMGWAKKSEIAVR